MPKPPSSPTRFRSKCPVACALDLVGDKWTLLVLRDCFLGKSKYADFQHSPESIPTNILADRLKKLERNGLVSKKKYQQRPVRHEYLLTPKGRALGPVMRELVAWSNRYIKQTLRLSEEQMEAILSRAG